MKVLVSDALSEAGLALLAKHADLTVDYSPGLKEDQLVAKIVDADALVIRSGSKVTKKVLEAATKLRVIGRAGIGVDNVDVDGGVQARHRRDEHADRQRGHDRRARHHAPHEPRAKDPAGDRVDEGRQVGEERSSRGASSPARRSASSGSATSAASSPTARRGSG